MFGLFKNKRLERLETKVTGLQDETYQQKQTIDRLIHLVVTLAQLQVIHPEVLQRRSQEYEKNVEYLQKMENTTVNRKSDK